MTYQEFIDELNEIFDSQFTVISLDNLIFIRHEGHTVATISKVIPHMMSTMHDYISGFDEKTIEVLALISLTLSMTPVEERE